MRTGFERFQHAVQAELRGDAPVPDRVRAVRARLTEALSGDEFVLDCVQRVTDGMETPLSRWRNPPIHEDRDLAFVVRMIYWPPRYENNPHRHETWTVTGVVLNRLRVATYRLEEEAPDGRLEEEKSLECSEGQVGYILPPCIHSISNASDANAISIHLFSGSPAQRGPGEEDHPAEPSDTVWYPAPRKGDIVRGAASRALMGHCELLERIGTPRAVDLLDRTFALGDRAVRLRSVKAMSRAAPMLAAERVHALAAECNEPARGELARLGERLMIAAGDG